jgi:hypothetical protein
VEGKLHFSTEIFNIYNSDEQNLCKEVFKMCLKGKKREILINGKKSFNSWRVNIRN